MKLNKEFKVFQRILRQRFFLKHFKSLEASKNGRTDSKIARSNISYKL